MAPTRATGPCKLHNQYDYVIKNTLVNVINHRAVYFLRIHIIILLRISFSSLLYRMPLSKENQVQMAVSASKSKKIKSKTQAAEIFGVSKTTLLRRLKGI